MIRRFVILLLAGAACADAGAPVDAETSSTGTPGDTSTTGEIPDGPALPPRPDVVTCRFDGNAPGLLPSVASSPTFDGLTEPVVDLAADDPTVYAALADRRIVALDPDDPAAPPVVLGDLSDRAAELVALAIRADHAATRQVWIRWTRDAPAATVIARYTLDAQTGALDLGSERIGLTISDAVGDRSGGALVFGADGMLYVGVGDYGEVPETDAPRDPTVRAGKLLRFDVDALDRVGALVGAPGNPFVGQGGASDEVWAMGLRDPWRCAFAAGDDRPWCVDVGVEEQEVDHIERAADHGWPRLEGNLCRLPGGDCGGLDVAPPVATHRSVDGDCGVVGAVRVVGDEALAGGLLWVDRCSGRIRGLDLESAEVVLADEILGVASGTPRALVPDGRGGVALLSDEGIFAVTGEVSDAVFPARLSESACFDDLRALVPTPGVVPFDVIAPLWTDGAIKTRFVVVPPGETIAFDDDGLFELPVGTVVLKNFAFEDVPGDPATRRSVETRVMKRLEHGWQFHSYRWNDAGSDAELLTAGEEAELAVGDQSFTYTWPSRANCKVCHGLGASNVVGLRLDQLARTYDYAGVVADQLQAMADNGLFAEPVPSDLVPLAAATDDEAPLERRARSWLHTNCGHCHRPGGWVPAALTMDLRIATALGDTHTCDVDTQYYNPWVTGDVRIVPGDPESSVIWQRTQLRDGGQMPPLATSLVDPESIVVANWIRSLAGCP